MNIKAILTVSALALALVACGDDSKGTEAVGDAGSIPDLTTTPDAAVIPGATPDAGTPAIPLILWVDDLVDHHTTDDSAPDTVDDKNISDDENPSQFDLRFQ